MAIHTSNPVTQEVEARSSSNPQLRSEFEISIGSMRPCLKTVSECKTAEIQVER